GLRSGRALARRPLQRPAARPRCGRPPPRGGLGAGPRGSAQAVVAGRGGLVGAAVAARRAGAARAVRGEGANPRRQRGGPEGQARHVPGVREAAEAAGGRRPGLGPGCAPVTPAAKCLEALQGVPMARCSRARRATHISGPSPLPCGRLGSTARRAHGSLQSEPPRPREAAKRDGPRTVLACRPCRENFLETLQEVLRSITRR
ncbi:unnamed protein product, partial [Prorocentrum cordatum]